MLAVITPLHAAGNPYIHDAYVSLLKQSNQDWQWHILENSGGHVPAPITGDSRVHVFRDKAVPSKIGALKLRLVEHVQNTYELPCQGIVELDCDDLLAPNALELIAAEFKAGADFVYSDFAEFREVSAKRAAGIPVIKTELNRIEASWDMYPYSEYYGWKHYPVHCESLDTQLFAMRAQPVTAHNLRLVDWSPNHVRCWTLDAYFKAGGHDPALTVADDHDLCVKFFLTGAKFHHIPECLYYYRVHFHNTVVTRNKEIRDATWANYSRYIRLLAEKFAHANDLLKIDLCGAISCPPGYTPIDSRIPSRIPREGSAYVVCDLNGAWDLRDSSVGVLRAYDALEHLRDPIHVMNEAWRVLAPGGFFMISVPSTSGKGAFCDPTHVSFWNDLSFRYYCNCDFSVYVPEFKGMFQALRILEWYPTKWHKDNNVPYVDAQLVKLADGYTPVGEVLFPISR